jgi:cytidylate kinase
MAAKLTASNTAEQAGKKSEKTKRIISLTGSTDVKMANELQTLLRASGQSATIIKTAKNISLDALHTCVSMAGTATVIITGFPKTLKQSEVFISKIKEQFNGGCNFFHFHISDGVRSASAGSQEGLAADYAQQLLRDGGGTGRCLMGEVPPKTTIEILSIITGFKQKVVVCGTAVSGKGTITSGIEKMLGYKVFSVGNDITRKFAEKHQLPNSENLSLDELVRSVIKKDKKMGDLYDDEADNYNKQIIRHHEAFVLECRLGAFFAGDQAFKVLMQVDNNVAGERLYYDIVNNPNSRYKQYGYQNAKEAAAGIIERNALDNERYLLKYGFNFMNTDHYDCVIDSVQTSKDDMLAVFTAAYQQFLVKKLA